ERLLAEFGFLCRSFGGVGEEIGGVKSAHDAVTGERDGDTRRVDGDPATSPLLGDIGRGAGAAGWVEDEITWVSGHEHAAFDCRICGLYNVNFWICSTLNASDVSPCVGNGECRKVVVVSNVGEGVAGCLHSSS